MPWPSVTANGSAPAIASCTTPVQRSTPRTRAAPQKKYPNNHWATFVAGSCRNNWHIRTFHGVLFPYNGFIGHKKQKHMLKYSTTHNKHNCMHQLIHPTIIHSFTTLFIHHTIHSFIILFIHHTIHSFILSFTPPYTHSFNIRYI